MGHKTYRELAIWTLFTAIIISTCTAQAATDKIGPELMKEWKGMDNSDSARVMVYLKDQPVTRAAPMGLSVQSAPQIEVRHSFSSFNGYSADVSSDDITTLLGDNNVLEVKLIPQVEMHLAESVQQIGADKVWDIQYGGEYVTGKGQSICVLDSGIDYTHSAFGGCTQAQFLAGTCTKVPWGIDLFNGDNDPMDGFGHGTHISGIIASEDATYKGVAPGAGIVAVKIFSDSGAGYWDDVLAGINACIANRSKYNIIGISMSFGSTDWVSGDPADCESDWFGIPAALADAKSRGLFIAASSGNDGETNGVTFPACNKNVVSVGDVYDYYQAEGEVCWFGGGCCDSGGSNIDIDSVICHSNRGDILDLWAPGYAIRSTVPGGTATKGGTSMAVAHVSGAAALLNQHSILVNGKSLTPQL